MDTDGRIDRHRQTDRQTDTDKHGQADRQTGRQAGRQTDKQTDTHADRKRETDLVIALGALTAALERGQVRIAHVAPRLRLPAHVLHLPSQQACRCNASNGKVE